MTSSGPLPLSNSYWVLPGQLLAGEYPGGSSAEETRERLKRVLAAGVECFIDLTQPNELDRYDRELPLGVEHLRKPIRDHGLPEEAWHMEEILDCIHDALSSGRKVYVHCRAGIGRTGMVVGCFLVERGMTGEAALDELNRVFQQSERSKSWDWVPETLEQGNFVRRWVTRGPHVSEAFHDANTGPESDPLLQPEALSAVQGLRNRFHGALVGLAVGDALAAATQYRRPGTFTAVGDLLGGGPFDLPRGAWSDDTSMALCLAESLLERNGFDGRDQVERYQKWQRQGYLSATGQCVGITASTARALAMAQWRRQAFSGSHDPGQLDPEPLSRVAAATLFFFANIADAQTNASESARTTCQAPVVLDACRGLSLALHGALSGQPKSAIIQEMAHVLSGMGGAGVTIGAATDASSGSGAAMTGAGVPTGTAPEVLAAAQWAFSTTDNFRDAVLRAVNVGGNSDVVAAVCGQLAGAHYTLSAIPVAWRNSLMQKDLIQGLADKLLAHALVELGE